LLAAGWWRALFIGVNVAHFHAGVCSFCASLFPVSFLGGQFLLRTIWRATDVNNSGAIDQEEYHEMHKRIMLALMGRYEGRHARMYSAHKTKKKKSPYCVCAGQQDAADPF
jgi:hypothetical protein